MSQTSPIGPRLPPLSDAITGEPRPPAAPRETTANEPTPTDRSPRRHPPAPEQLGSILEWTQDTPRSALLAGGGMCAIAIVFLTVINGFDWMRMWYIWPMIGLAGFGIYRKFDREWTAAGANWVQCGKVWVETTALTSIKFGVDGANRVLRLEDNTGHKIYSFRLRSVQANPQLWNLVYNGILHSVASGTCDITPKARKALRIPADLGQQARE